MSDVDIQLQGPIAILEIRRPPANFFDLALVEDIADAMEEQAASGTRAVVLSSEGKHFCAGANFGAPTDEQTRTVRSIELYKTAIRLFRVPIPVVAAVQGSAVGGGMGLACAADFRVASPSTRFHANFVQLGFHPGFGLTASLPEIVGSQVALDLLLSGRRVGGEEAHAVGLADRLVGDGDVRARAIDWAVELAQGGPLAVRSTKATLRRSLADRVEAALEREMIEQAQHWQTEDFRTGIEANLRRERPSFVGR